MHFIIPHLQHRQADDAVGVLRDARGRDGQRGVAQAAVVRLKRLVLEGGGEGRAAGEMPSSTWEYGMESWPFYHGTTDASEMPLCQSGCARRDMACQHD